MRRISANPPTVTWTGTAWPSWPDDGQRRIFDDAGYENSTDPGSVGTLVSGSRWIRPAGVSLPE